MTIVEQISEWANKDKPGWWKYAIRKALASGSLTQKDLDDVFYTAKIENGLLARPSNYLEFISNVNPTGFGAESAEYNLKSINDVQFVSALSGGCSLEFANTGLTIVYGNNGVGKSSYAKILKNACLTRGDSPHIKPNVFKGDTGTPSARIETLSRGQTHSNSWMISSPPIEQLKSIRVFDSLSSTHYLTKPGIIEFKPPALTLLDELKKAVEYVKAKAGKERGQLTCIINLPPRHPNTLAGQFRITPRTTELEVVNLCSTIEEDENLQGLLREHHSLVTKKPAEIRRQFRQNIELLTPFLGFLKNLQACLGDTSIEGYKQLLNDAMSKREVSNKLGQSAFSSLPFEGIGTHEWQIMWASVGRFVSQVAPQRNFPPKTNEVCPACVQPIDAGAAGRLQSFKEYLESDIHEQANQAENTFTRSIQPLNSLSLTLAPYEAAINWIASEKTERRGILQQLVNEFQLRLNSVVNRKLDVQFKTIDETAIQWIEAQIELLKTEELKVKDDRSLEDLANSKLVQIHEIQDRQIIKQFKPLILKEAERLRLLQNYMTLDSTTNTASITTLNSKISKAGSTGKISQYFREELNELGFINYEVEVLIKGSKNSQLMSLSLPGQAGGLVDIASEGEQKCISLAGFFAELKADDRKSGIVFDDPVNSLDHQWRMKFAKRIAKESISRQVIVFTHDIVFLWMLQNAADEHRTIALSRNKHVTGIPQDRPPWDAQNTKSRIGVLKVSLPKLKKLEHECYDDFIEASKNLYSKMRETWERMIEEWLIRDVVQRFGREVKPQNIRYLVDITDSDVNYINKALEHCNTRFSGHDTPPECGGGYPCYEEVESDINDIEAYFKELKKRRP